MKSSFPGRHQTTLRRAGLFGLFSACSLALMAASSPQCARVDDSQVNPLSSYSLDAADAACEQTCAALAVDARRAEHVRFVEAIKSCQDPECRQEEAGLHAQIMQEIAQDQENCRSSCHHQGGGSGGN